MRVVLSTIVILAGCAGGPRRSASPVYDAQVTDGLNRLRAATRPFQNLDAAVAAGYPREVADCLVHEHHGAMGFHHVNRSYLDTRRDIERPQILLYERLPDGNYRLNAVEFIIPYRLWPRDSVAPVIMGQRLHHEDNLKFWYLHVWAWLNNPDGVFANFNSAVSCPSSSRKVYTPSPLEG
ncbi:MAG: hypothetical protein M3O61_00020 [Gemmatimonadota bacterium]|nr:hypothetical protein [Gemmatimonadota bacterium]